MMKSVCVSILVSLLFFSCGPDTANSDEGSNSKKDSIGSAKQIENDTLPHEVRTGKEADYGYFPDTCIKKLVMGNSQSWVDFCKENGSSMFKLDQTHLAGCYFNAQRTEFMQVGVTPDEKGNEVVYSLIIQKSGDEKSPPLLGRPIPASDLNFISGSGIYIGMSQEYVMRVYMDQVMTQRQYCDTTFLVYQPKEKDRNGYKRYNWKSYSAVYKFVDNELRRMEYEVNPSEFQKQ